MNGTMRQIPSGPDLSRLARETAGRCGVDPGVLAGDVTTTSPVNGEQLANVTWVDGAAVDEAVSRARAAFLQWRAVPAPARGALVKRLGELLAVHKDDLATLISLEVGKITSEALGEVQEMIDICDFAVGLSRQLYGRTMTSERPGHRLMETWHPLGVVGVISAFNFPVAVWSWNTAVALVCGDPVIWKPSELAPLTALASDAILARAIADCGAPRRPRPGARRRSRTSGRRWSTTPAWPCSAPPARPAWGGRSARGSPTASAGPCSSSAATTPPSSRPTADLDLTTRGSCSPPPAPRASAARPCGG